MKNRHAVGDLMAYDTSLEVVAPSVWIRNPNWSPPLWGKVEGYRVFPTDLHITTLKLYRGCGGAGAPSAEPKKTERDRYISTPATLQATIPQKNQTSTAYLLNYRNPTYSGYMFDCFVLQG